MRFKWGTLRRVGLTSKRSGFRLLCLVVLSAVFVLPAGSASAIIGDDYPARLKSAAQDALADPWLFYNRECTSFVAWRLNDAADIPFHNYYLGEHWGNASNWKYAAEQVGVPVDGQAVKGAIAWWRAGSAGSSRGHVAWVDSVNADSITIEEYNYLHRGGYDTRVIARTSPMWPSAFIHVTGETLTNTERPSIEGVPQVGVKLTATAGTWSSTGLTYAYQWFAGGEPIPDATTRKLKPTAAELGKRLNFQVTAEQPGADPVVVKAVRTKRVAPGVLTSTSPPVIKGDPQVGEPVRTTHGKWSKKGEYTFQWYAGGDPVSGATDQSFTPTATEVAKDLSVQVSAARLGYTTATTEVQAADAVAPGQFTNEEAPTVTGVPQVGVPLSATTGGWLPTGIYRYQWLSDGTPVPGATAATFVPTANQLRGRISVRVSAEQPGYTTKTVESAVTSPVLAGEFLSSRAPSVHGTAQVGHTVSANPGTWTPSATFGYQWFAGPNAISGAIASTFSPGAAQVGLPLSVKVTATADGYNNSVLTSAATTPVALGRISNTAAPTLIGRPHVGGRLKAEIGSWSVTPTEVTYQWLLDGSPIAGATDATFFPTKANRLHRIAVRVGVEAEGYSPTGARTAGSPVLVGKTAFAEDPTLHGTAEVGRNLRVRLGAVTPSNATLVFRWFRGETPITGARSGSYRLTSADAGHHISVRVRIERAEWVRIRRWTEPSDVVRRAP